MRILLVEDNARFAELLAHGIRATGFAIDSASTLVEADELLELVSYDLILLDLSLPDGDGLKLVKRLRACKNPVPILIITARSGLDDRVTGLNLGADDYLVKPFATEELVARCRALLRRPGAVLGNILTVANVSLDSGRREACVDGQRLDLPPRELALLEELMRRAGQVVLRTNLETSLYALDKEVSPNALEAAVSRLRKRLNGAQADVTLHTAHGVGYAIVPNKTEQIHDRQ